MDPGEAHPPNEAQGVGVAGGGEEVAGRGMAEPGREGKGAAGTGGAPLPESAGAALATAERTNLPELMRWIRM